MAISKLKTKQLYTICDLKKFTFASTAELEERLSALGQDRALSAVELGINIKSKGILFPKRSYVPIFSSDANPRPNIMKKKHTKTFILCLFDEKTTKQSITPCTQ